MKNTTNYGLRKYQSGDLFNPLTVNNPNLDDIDTDMKAISDRTIGRATELVSQGVHAITLLDTDCKTFKFVATGNYSAGETFTVNGIQANAYTPSGSALVSNAFVTGSIVLGTLNEDDTAITFYVTGSAVADDSLKLGGELPSYYATQSDMTSAKTNITNLKNQAGNTSIVGIGDGTLSGAVSSLNNDLDDLRRNSGMRPLDMNNAVQITTTGYTPNVDGALFGYFGVSSGSSSPSILKVDTEPIARSTGTINCTDLYFPVASGQVIAFDRKPEANGIKFAPYKK